MPTSARIEEFWLLNLAVETDVRIADLVPFQGLGLNSVPLPGFDLEKLRSLLLRLSQCGLILVRLTESSPEASDRLSPIDIDRGLSSSAMHRSLIFELTREGGKRWEEYAEPDWNAFVGVSIGSNEGIAYSQDFPRLLALLMCEKYATETLVDFETMDVALKSDVEVLYWKTLASALVATFRTTSRPAPVPLRPEWLR